jgi:hypothetical protein
MVLLGNQHAFTCLKEARERTGTIVDISISYAHRTPFSSDVTHLKFNQPRTHKISMP